MLNSLDPDQDQQNARPDQGLHCVGPDLSQNCLQRLPKVENQQTKGIGFSLVSVQSNELPNPVH